jgi:hypothetical protein
LSISINLAGSVPSWNADANLPFAAGCAAEAVSLAVVESLLTGPEAAPDAASARVPDAGLAATQGQVPAQAGAPGLPVLSAQPVAARALGGRDSLGMPEDWFESSVPVKNIAGASLIEAADPAQLTHAGPQASSRLDATRPVEGLLTAAIEPGRQVRSNQVDFETVPVQSLAAELTAGTVAAKAALEAHRPYWPGIQSGDPLAREIPLLFAPVPPEPQPAPLPIRFRAVVANGVTMLGAVLAAILVGTLNLKSLQGIERMELAAAVLAIPGALYLIFRWARPRQS